MPGLTGGEKEGHVRVPFHQTMIDPPPGATHQKPSEPPGVHQSTTV